MYKIHGDLSSSVCMRISETVKNISRLNEKSLYIIFSIIICQNGSMPLSILKYFEKNLKLLYDHKFNLKIIS